MRGGVFASLKYLTFNGRCDRLIRGKKGQKKKKETESAGKRRAEQDVHFSSFIFFFFIMQVGDKRRIVTQTGAAGKKKKRKEQHLKYKKIMKSSWLWIIFLFHFYIKPEQKNKIK